jgi:hypothetical protein
MHTERLREGNRMYGCCEPMMKHGPCYCGMGLGIMLVLAGAIWLATRAGWFDPELFWPVAFLAAGFAVIALNLLRRRSFRTNHPQNSQRRNHENACSKE